MYVRKSRSDLEAEAAGQGETLARHIQALTALAKHRNFDVQEIYREIVSGETIAARPVMQQLLAEVEQGAWEGVLVMEVERLARGDTVDQGIVAQTFKFSATKIITPMKDYDPCNEFDEEYFEFGLFMSRREYKTINRRLQRGREASVKEGKFVGSKPPYGYRTVKLPDAKGFSLDVVPEEAEVVRNIFDWYVNGMVQADGSQEVVGIPSIAKKLDSMAVAPRVGQYWSAPSIRDILQNPVYIGKIRWNWRKTIKTRIDGRIVAKRPRSEEGSWILTDGRHRAIVDPEVYHLAQERKATNPPHASRGKIQNPLAGLVVCGKCGRKMVRRPYMGETKDTLMCYNTHCDNVSSTLEVVEQRVLDSLRDWVAKYGIRPDTAPKKGKSEPEDEKQRKKLRAEMETLSAQKDRLYDLLEQGVYSTDDFLERSGKLAGRIHMVEEALKSVTEAAHLREQRDSVQAAIIPKVIALLKVYGGLESPAERNNLLRGVLDRIVYRKDVGGRWSGMAGQFELTLYPLLPK